MYIICVLVDVEFVNTEERMNFSFKPRDGM